MHVRFFPVGTRYAILHILTESTKGYVASLESFLGSLSVFEDTLRDFPPWGACVTSEVLRAIPSNET